MALFFLAALRESAPVVDLAVQAKVQSADCYQIESGKWIIDAGLSTSKDLSDFLMLTPTTSHFVVPIRGYFGRAQPDLWEWLAAKMAKVNA
jgi:hypothetical protein